MRRRRSTRPAPVTAENIERALNLLRRCKTIAEVNRMARSLSHFVQEVEESPAFFERAHHIKNLAEHRRRMISRGLG